MAVDFNRVKDIKKSVFNIGPDKLKSELVLNPSSEAFYSYFYQ